MSFAKARREVFRLGRHVHTGTNRNDAERHLTSHTPANPRAVLSALDGGTMTTRHSPDSTTSMALGRRIVDNWVPSVPSLDYIPYPLPSIHRQ